MDMSLEGIRGGILKSAFFFLFSYLWYVKEIGGVEGRFGCVWGGCGYRNVGVSLSRLYRIAFF